MIRKVLFWIITGLVSMALIFILALQLPVVQNLIKDKVLDYLSTQTGQTIELDQIHIKWFDQVAFSGLHIRDYNDSTLLKVQTLDVDYSIADLFAENHLVLDDVIFSNGELNLINYKDSLAINMVEFINALKLLRNPDKVIDETKEPFRLSVTQVEFNEFGARIANQNADATTSERINFADFKIDIGHAGLFNFEVKKDTIEATISYFSGTEARTLFEISEFYSFFRLTNKDISLTEFHLKTPHSEIGDSLVLNFDSFQDFNQFNTMVALSGNLRNSSIDLYDLSYFGNVPKEHRVIELSTGFSGEVAALGLRNLVVKYGARSGINGDIDFYGLPKIEEAFIDARIQSAVFHANDFSEFLQDYTDNVKALGIIRFNGQFLGFANDFVANATFDTDQGKIISDINLKFPEGFQNAKYAGNLLLDDFNAGALIKDPGLLQRVNLDGKIDGKGLTIKNANFLLDAEIKETGILGYEYQYIKANGRFAASYFQGSLLVDDPHCQINGGGTLNLGVFPEEIEVKAFVEQLDLLALGFSEEDISIKTSIYANIRGLDIDSLVGRINLDSSTISWDDRTIVMDTIAINSEKSNEHRLINIEFAEAKMELKGDFYFSQLFKDIATIAREYKEYFDPNFEYKGYRRMSEVNQYSVDLSLEYQNINTYLQFFTDDIYISEGGLVEGTFYQRKNATLFLFTEIDSIIYKESKFYNNVIDINASKDIDSLGVIASIYVNSEKQNLRKGIPETEDLSLEAVWLNNLVDIQAHIAQPTNNSSAQVNAKLTLERDRLVFNFIPSNMVAFGERWFFNPYNKVEVRRNGITVDRLEIYNGLQSINLSGYYSYEETTDLKLNFKAFELHSISPVIPIPIEGTLTCLLELKKVPESENFQLLSDIDLQSLVVDNLLVGDIQGSSNWVDGMDGVSMDFVVIRESVRTINVEGFYFPNKESDQLDAVIEFDQANIRLLEPLFSSMFSGMGGAASGSIKVSGSLDYPLLNGDCRIKDGSFTFDYLKTNYKFNGNIGFDNESIRLNRIEILDRDGERASLDGKIAHKGFKKFSLQLGISATRFLFLNTTQPDNSLYYGSAKASGDIRVTGPVTDLLIQVKARTESGTKIFIPIEDGNEVGQKEYISFADLSDTTNQVNIDEVVSDRISGVRLDFDLDITTDAYIELIFNIKTGDIIRGRGTGNLNMSLDTQGEFQLFGDINISDGGYNFTIPNFINKEFSIQPGSTISWYGDPYAGILNLNAIYRQMATLGDYFPTIEGGPEGVNQRYPFLVILGLEGNMLSPQIDFEIKIDENIQPETSDQVALASINNDEQELKRQVFSLLILRKFSVQDGFSLGGGAVGSSLSEFLSNQFSYFISQVDENLEVDIDLSTYRDVNAFNTFQLRLAYTFMDGRLRVSGGGQVYQGNDASSDNFMGDWSVRYLLTKDGHLRIKAFSQARQRVASVSSAANLFRETGVSFQYIKSFDEFSDLLKKSRDESIKDSPAPEDEGEMMEM